MKEKQILDIFAALSQATRLKVFRILVDNSKKGICPCEIAHTLNIPRNTLSFHLSLLRRAKLCFSEKTGKTIIYRPDCETIKEASEYLLKNCCAAECSPKIRGNHV